MSKWKRLNGPTKAIIPGVGVTTVGEPFDAPEHLDAQFEEQPKRFERVEEKKVASPTRKHSHSKKKGSSEE